MEELARELLKIAKLISAAPKFRVGDLVQFKGMRRVYKVEKVDQWGRYSLRATTGGVRGSNPTNVDEHDIQEAGTKEVPVDKNGRTAFEAAEYLYPVGERIIVDRSRTVSEQVGKVLKITKGGQIVVQLFGRTPAPRNFGDQETYVPDFADKTDRIVFSPAAVYRGEWAWENGREGLYIKGVYKGKTITKLLD